MGKAGHYYLLQDWTQKLFMCTALFTKHYCYYSLKITDEARTITGNKAVLQYNTKYHSEAQIKDQESSPLTPLHSQGHPPTALCGDSTARHNRVAKYPNCKRFECGLYELLSDPKLTICLLEVRHSRMRRAAGYDEDQSHQKTTVVPIKLEEAESSSASKTSDKNEASSVENTSEESNCSRKPICETIKKESINIPSRAKEVPTVNSVQPRSVEIDISKECINDDVCGVEKQGNVKTTERTNPDITDESNLVCKEPDSTGLEISRQRFWDEFLPITRRGSFFQDSFFSDMHTKFDAAIRKVLNRWSSNELEWTDTWDDVGFHYKDILERYRELRSRHLEENLAVTVTSDKTGHKKCQRKEAVVPVQLESKEEEAVRAGHGGSPADVLVSPDEAEKKGSSADLLSPTSDDDDEEGYTFIVRRPGNSYGVSFGDDEDSHAWKRESSAGDSRSKCALKSSGLDCESRNLAIVRKGLFADDCCFENVRRNYSQAVRQVLEKANEWSCGSDTLDKYRKLRQQKVSLENQAVGVSEDSESHQIVMDVLDFLGGDVTVRLVEGKELLVEGQAERQDGGRVSRVSFVRRFALPELVERDAVSCVLSSDGILTIVSEKKGDAPGQRDRRSAQ
ncbi:heat shock protein 21 [Penaeus vannamei]|uniref:Heat shock protein 21 n=1 Tax=Penaeus vannamei TaxID=6689 RepID=A0A3R7SR42_PENVA|nr:heat shock protein 21 [Penaeus vannamei]